MSCFWILDDDDNPFLIITKIVVYNFIYLISQKLHCIAFFGLHSVWTNVMSYKIGNMQTFTTITYPISKYLTNYDCLETRILTSFPKLILCVNTDIAAKGHI